MPSYDFMCRGCASTFELFSLGLLKEESKVCPECGGTQVEQLFTGFQFKHSTAGGDAGCSSAPFR